MFQIIISGPRAQPFRLRTSKWDRWSAPAGDERNRYASASVLGRRFESTGSLSSSESPRLPARPLSSAPIGRGTAAADVREKTNNPLCDVRNGRIPATRQPAEAGRRGLLVVLFIAKGLMVCPTRTARHPASAGTHAQLCCPKLISPRKLAIFVDADFDGTVRRSGGAR